MLSRNDILGRLQDLADVVAVPELGGAIGIGRLSFAEAMALAEAGKQVGEGAEAQEAFLVRLVIACARDRKGRPLFKPEDAEALRMIPAGALQRIADVALRVNGLSESALEDAEGNSAAIPGGAGS